MVKVINISSPERIIAAFGQTLRITKALAFANTSSTRINFYHHLAKVLLAYSQHYSLTEYNSQRLLKTTKSMQTEIHEVTKINTLDPCVNTESNIDNTKVI